MSPLRREHLRKDLAKLDAWLAPHLKQRADLAALIDQPDDPLDTELERAQCELADAVASEAGWQHDQEMCDGLDDGPPMRIPEFVFRRLDQARARVARATETLRLAGRTS
jgi:hypothetical protein